MNTNNARYCKCGRELYPDEEKCPACKNSDSTFWKTVGGVGTAFGALIVVGIKFFIKK